MKKRNSRNMEIQKKRTKCTRFSSGVYYDYYEQKKKKYLKLLPPTPKLQAWNEIQNVLFKNCMAIMQNSLHRKLNSTAIVDDSFSPSKTKKTQSLNNFGNNFQANILGKF